jgi:hypothetical protein
LLISSIVASNTCSVFAADATPIKSGQPAPYDGLLLTPEKAQEVKNTYVERDGYKLLNDSLQKSLDLSGGAFNLSEQKVNILLEQNNKLAVNLNEARTTSNFEKFMWFGLGVLGASLAVYGVKKAAQ